MLCAKPWKAEAIIRLLLSIFTCQLIGAVVMSVARFSGVNHRINPWGFGALAAGSVIFSIAALVVLHRPWDLTRFTRPFLTMTFCLYLGLTLGAFSQHFAGKSTDTHSTVRTVAAALSFQGVGLLFIWRFVREHQVCWREAFGFTVNWKIALPLGVTVACVFLPVGRFLQMISTEILSRLHVEPEIQPAVQALKNSATSLDRVFVGIVAIGLAPLAEEMLFRGILYPVVKQRGFPRLALWGTSLLFAAIHWNAATFAPLLLLAIALTLVYEKTGNLLAPITAHALFNALNFAMFYFIESKFGPPG